MGKLLPVELQFLFVQRLFREHLFDICSKITYTDDTLYGGRGGKRCTD